MALLNAGGGFWALKKLEKKAGTPIQGTFLPHLFRPAFTLQDARLSWQNRFQVLSGDIGVRYDPLSLFPGRKFHVYIKATGLRVRLFQDLLESQGLAEIGVEEAKAELAFSREGPPEIFLFNVQSPELRFNLVKK